MNGDTRRPRVLLLTPRWPYPVSGGDRLRVWRLADAVAQSCDVTLLSLCEHAEQLHQPLPADAPFAEVHRVLLRRARSWMQVIAALPGSVPMQVAYYRSRTYEALAREIAASHDLVWCHLARTAPYGLSAGRPCWVELTDAVSLTMERAAQVRGRMRSWLYRLESRRMLHFETAVLDQADMVSVISEVDGRILAGPRNSHRARMVVAGNGVELPPPGLPAGLRPPRIALLGRMDSAANRDAMWHFVDRILPEVLRRRADVRLRVIGHVRRDDARRLARHRCIELTGVVDRLSQALADCRVGVCPVRFGAGVQNKMLDYMAHGLAAVTSPVGLEGLGATPGRELLVAGPPGEWVDAVCNLLQDDVLATEVSSAGRAHVASHFEWASMLAPAVEALHELLDDITRSAASSSIAAARPLPRAGD